LFESRAITRYICAKYANQGEVLIPTDLKANALFEQAMSIEVTDFEPSASKAVAEKIFKKYVIIIFCPNLASIRAYFGR
jgi:glutathione S-transferase